MVFTLRITVGFILLLFAINSLESASPWRQTRQIKSSDLFDSKNASFINNEADKLPDHGTKLINKIAVNETHKNDEINTKSKTEDSTETLRQLDLNLKSNNVSSTKNSSEEISTEEESQKHVNKKSKDERKKEKLTREEASRSLDIDIEKYTSSDFHNKNNVYTLPVSPDIEKYVSTDYESSSTTQSTYKYSRYADFHTELTTPKNELFDLKHRQIEEGVQQHLEEINTYFQQKEEGEKVPNVDTLLDKVNDTNVQLDYKAFKTINQNNSKNNSSIHKDLLTEKGSNLYFNETYNETKLIDEQNIIPITGPDFQLNDSDKLDTSQKKDNNILVPSVVEKKLNISASEDSVVHTTLDNVDRQIITTLIKSNESVRSQKPILPTTDKPTLNLLTKPPISNKTSSLISNKIEVDKIKPIEIEKIKLSTDSSDKISNFLKGEESKNVTSAINVHNVAERSNSTNDSLSDDLNVEKNQIVKIVLPSPENETTIQTTTTIPDINSTNKVISSTETVTLFLTTELTTELTTSQWEDLTTTIDYEETTIDLKTTTDAQTINEISTTNAATKIEEETASTALETTSEFILTETTTTFNNFTSDNESSTQQNFMMSDGTTQSLSSAENDTTIISSATEPTTSAITLELNTSSTVDTNAIIKSNETVSVNNNNDTLIKSTEETPQESLVNRTNQIFKNSINSTTEDTPIDFNNDTRKLPTESDEDIEEEYSDSSPKSNNDILKLHSSTMSPLNKNISNNETQRKEPLPSIPVPPVTVNNDEDDTTTSDNLELPKEDSDGKVIAIAISCVGAICLIALVVLLIIMRKRQKRFNYGQRCTPVSLDDYSMDNVSVYNSVRRKGVLRFSKRSYGNPAFDDPSSLSHQLNFPALAKFGDNAEEIRKEFDQIPQVTTRTNELPEGCEVKNRYANVIPLPETRVFLNSMDGYPNSNYINANYVTGPKAIRNYYIACQAPMQNTVEDFWRMVWEQQSKVILMLTHIFENGVEKSFDYLPPSEVTDCQRLFGDLQVILKRREVKTKYIISTIQLKNMVSNSWREITQLWYIGWPDKGVPEEANSIITFLIEARSYLKIAMNTGNNNYTLPNKDATNGNNSNQPTTSTSPMVVHCSPGTGRTGTVIACDIAIREFELTRQVDIPKIVYKIRRDRASSVQTRDQYAFIYKVISLYATKLTGGGLDSI